MAVKQVVHAAAASIIPDHTHLLAISYPLDMNSAGGALQVSPSYMIYSQLFWSLHCIVNVFFYMSESVVVPGCISRRVAAPSLITASFCAIALHYKCCSFIVHVPHVPLLSPSC